MKKMAFFGFVALAVLVVYVVCTAVCTGLRHQVTHGESPKRHIGTTDSHEMSTRRQVSENNVYHYPTDHETREELRKVYDSIAVAYSNRQTSAMREIFSGVKARISSLRDADFQYVEHSVYSAYQDALFFQHGGSRDFRPPDDFTDLASFNQYVNALLELVKIVADGHIARQGHDGYKGIEAIPLRLLREYKVKFKEEGRHDLERHADRMISNWIAFIESESGYSHGYARWVFPYNLKIHEGENNPREIAVMITRLDASVELETIAGYVPKWLEEIK